MPRKPPADAPEGTPLAPGSLSDESPPTAPKNRPKPPPTHARLNGQGLIELVDLITGRVVAVQKSYRDLLNDKFEDLTEIQTPDGPVWIEKGLQIDRIRLRREFPYSRVMADLICEKVAEGQGLLKAVEELGIKYSTVCRWRREHEEFKDALKQARQDRGEFYHDEALDRARAATKDTVAEDRLAVDTAKWAAEKADPGTFGAQKPGQGQPGAGAIIVQIATGITRIPSSNPHPALAPREVTPVLEQTGDGSKEWTFEGPNKDD